MSERARHASIIAIFFVSGAAGLVYEVLWGRQLALIFGVTTYAVATVLATFMGGLALGSYLFGRWIDRRQNPLAAYAALEAGIGLYAFLVPVLFDGLRPAYVMLWRLDLSYPVLAAARALFGALVLLPPTILMGGTFPILTRYFVRTPNDVGRGAGLLYFINTAGAIAGCVLAGFYLVENYGLTGTTYLTGSINLAVGAVAALLARNASTGRAAPTAQTSPEIPDAVSSRTLRVALLAIGLSGFTALGYEVVWTRALPRFLYNSTYAFTTMLSTFLLGIALGSAIYLAWLRRLKRPMLLFAVLQALVGFGFVASSLVFPSLPDAITRLMGTDVIGSFADSVRNMFVGSSLILLPPVVLLGAMLPLATSICARGLETIGHTVGRVYAINTLGAIFGSLGAGFVLIPTIGMQGTLTLLILVNLALAAVLASVALSSRLQSLVATAALAAAGIAAVSALPSGFFKKTLPQFPATRIVYYDEGATDTVAVAEFFGQRVILYGDRRGTASTTSYPFDYFQAHLGMLLHPGEPRNVLHICFGVGNSISAVTAYDVLERVDNVELSPHVLEAARYFWTNNGVIDHPKVRTIIDDGRNYLMATRETYDLMMLAPPETFTAGVINLYTRDFYEDALAHLAPDGLMVQWVPTGKAPLDQERMLFRAFQDVFPYSTLWSQLDTGSVLLVGSRKPVRIDYQRLKRQMADVRVRRDFELMQVEGVDHLLAYFLFDEATFQRFVRGVAPTTDERTVLDFAMPRYLGSGFGMGVRNLQAKQDGRVPASVGHFRRLFYIKKRTSVVPYLRNLGGEDPTEVARRIESRAGQKLVFPAIPEREWERW